MRKRIHIIGVIGFLIVISFGFLGLIVGPDEQLITTLEQTSVVPFPDFRHRVNHENLRQLEFWWGQRIFGRGASLKGFVGLYYALGESAYPRQVVLGKDDWLFVGNNFGNSTDKVMGIAPANINNINYYLSRTSRIHAHCSANNIVFLYLIAPNKEAIYPEFLPSWVKYARPGIQAEQFLTEKARQHNLPVLNLKPVLLNAKNKITMPLYQKQNSHWNFLGAFMGYHAMMMSLKKQNDNLRVLLDGKVDVNTPLSSDDDLRKMLLRVPAKAENDNWPIRFGAIDKNQTYELTIYTQLEQQRTNTPMPNVRRQVNRVEDELFIPITAEIYVMTNPNVLNKNRLLLIGDSFLERMNPYLIATFNEIIRVNINILQSPEHIIWLINQFRPNTVVVENVARSL